MRRLWARLLASEAGNIVTLFALILPIVIGVAAFAVDEAALYLEKRRLQATADLAAIHAAGDPANAHARALEAFADAGYSLPPEAVRVATGRYEPDPGRAAHLRFTEGQIPLNAVTVSADHPGRIHFATIFGMAPPRIGASATASATPLAAFSIGSRLAGLDEGVLNAVLGGLLGTNLSLGVLDYEAIANLDVGLLDFLDALAGEVGLTVGTYDQLLSTEVGLGPIAAALSSAAGGEAVLLELAGLIDDGLSIEMVRLLAADGLAHLAIGTSAAIEARVNALEMLTAAAMIADGARQIALDLGLGIPGIAGVEVTAVVGEPPQGGWFTLGPQGAYVRTAQVRLRIDIAILGAVDGLGLLSIRVPVYAEIAPGEAELAALACPPGRPERGSATIAATPGVLRLAIGHTAPERFLDTRQPLSVREVPIVTLLGGIARINAFADVEMARAQPEMLYFTHADIAAGTVRTATTNTPLSTLTDSLLRTLKLEVEILRVNLLGWLLSGATALVRPLLAPITLVLDEVLNALFTVLGVGLGTADLRLHGFDCRNATLVQ